MPCRSSTAGRRACRRAQFAEWVDRADQADCGQGPRRQSPRRRSSAFRAAATLEGYETYVRETGVDAVSLDTAAPMRWAVQELGSRVALQGNLDPIALDRGRHGLVGGGRRRSWRRREGVPFIFNLGHGILPETPIEHVAQLVAQIRGIAVKLAVVLFNLGGPDAPEAVEPFLRNLFSDPAIITLPAICSLTAGAADRGAPRARSRGRSTRRSAGVRRSSRRPRRRRARWRLRWRARASRRARSSPCAAGSRSATRRRAPSRRGNRIASFCCRSIRNIRPPRPASSLKDWHRAARTRRACGAGIAKSAAIPMSRVLSRRRRR